MDYDGPLELLAWTFFASNSFARQLSTCSSVNLLTRGGAVDGQSVEICGLV